MIEQIRMIETFTSGTSTGLPRVVFGFGTHDTATPDEAHMVTTAQAASNKFRIIMDHLLVGNNLEEIQCRFPVDANGVFARVPIGATPDDIARCSSEQDVLPSLCPGSNKLSVCICQLDAGCPSGMNGDGTLRTTPKGQSVGVQDANLDGAADDTEFIKGAVALSCDGHTIDADLEASYWTPSGDQQVPAQGGFDALGPAIVFVPAGPMPTNVPCSLVFASDVVDKAGVKVCAPPGGDINRGCNPGDVSAVSFKVEPMTLALEGQLAQLGKKKLTDAITVQANTQVSTTLQLDPTQPNSVVTMTENGAPFTAFTVSVPTPQELTIQPALPGLMPNTPYVITYTTGVTDIFGEPLPQPVQLSFTTGTGN